MESHQLFGLDWIKERVSKSMQIFPAELLVRFYLSIEATPELWDWLDSGDQQMRDLYWNSINVRYHPWFHRDHHERFVGMLNRYGRYATAINSMHDVGRVSDDLIIEALTGYAMKEKQEDVAVHSGTYMFGKLIKKLVNNHTDKEILVSLQWQYFQVLNQERDPLLVAALYEDLCAYPEHFAALVYFKWKPDVGDFEEDFAKAGKDSVMGRGQNADDVLEKWQKLPGMDDQGNCDFGIFRDYFSKALVLCQDKNRRKRGLYELGERLGRGKFTISEWPHPQVCAIIDEYDDADLCRGFYMGYQNRGGIRVTSGVYDKQHAVKNISYLLETAERLSIHFPVTAKVVNEIADSKAHWDAYEAKRAAQDDD